MTNLSRRALLLGMASAAVAAVARKIVPLVPTGLVASKLGGYLVPADFQELLIQRFAEAAAAHEDNAFMYGDGTDPPEGVLAVEPEGEVTGVVRATWVIDGSVMHKLPVADMVPLGTVIFNTDDWRWDVGDD